jgi:chromosome segregation ATPase
MFETKKALVSFKSELTERLSGSQNEMKLNFAALIERLELMESKIEGRISGIEGRISDIEGRISGIEGRIDDLSASIEIRHVDVWKLVEQRHGEMWKLLVDLNNSLPITVAISTSESTKKLSDAIRSEVADTRQEIVAAISKVATKDE